MQLLLSPEALFIPETKQRTPKKRKHLSSILYLQRAKWDNQMVYALQITMFVIGTLAFAGCNSPMRQEEVDRYWFRSNSGDSTDVKIEDLLGMDEDDIKLLYLKHSADGTLYKQRDQ